MERVLASQDNSEELEVKWSPRFDSQARYMGNGVYNFAGIVGTDIRAVFVEAILGCEGIDYEKENIHADEELAEEIN